MPQTRLTAQQKAQIRVLYKQGTNLNEIAQRIGASRTAVRYWIDKENPNRPKQRRLRSNAMGTVRTAMGKARHELGQEIVRLEQELQQARATYAKLSQAESQFE